MSRSRVSAIRLPGHRTNLLRFWAFKSDPKLSKAQSLIAKLILCKLWKEGLEPGKELPSHIKADADNAMDEIREALVRSDVCFLEDLFKAAKENGKLREKGVIQETPKRQDYTREIILAYSQFYFANNPSSRPVVLVELDRPHGISLKNLGGWTLEIAKPIEPTKKQLWNQLCAGGVQIPKPTYTRLLKDIGLDDLESDRAGRPAREKPKLVSKRFF